MSIIFKILVFEILRFILVHWSHKFSICFRFPRTRLLTQCSCFTYPDKEWSRSSIWPGTFSVSHTVQLFYIPRQRMICSSIWPGTFSVSHTVQLFYIPRQRMISLKYLTWYFLSKSHCTAVLLNQTKNDHAFKCLVWYFLK